MIHNPYAKKRPRPSGWTSSTSTSSTVSTSKPVEQQRTPSSTKNRAHESFPFGPRNSNSYQEGDGVHNYRENATNQISDSFNGFCNSKKENLEKQLIKHTTLSATHPSQKTQPNPQKRNIAKVSTKNDLSVPDKKMRSMATTLAVNCPARKLVYNPYARKNNTQTQVTVPNAKPSDPPENVHHHSRKVDSNHRARLPIGINSTTSAHEKQIRTTSIENHRPQSKASSLVGSTATNKTVSSKVNSKLTSSMKSIRPASWKSNIDSPRSTSIIVQRKLGTESLKGATDENVGRHPIGQTEDAVDRLPRELSYTPDEVKPIQDEYRMLLIKNAKLSSPLKNGWMLFPHQKKAIIRALTMRRMILALDMGLGKTLIGTVWSKAFKETFGHDRLKVFVVCPVSLKEEWKRTAEGIAGLDVDDEGKGKSKSKSKKSTKMRKTSQGRSQPEVSREKIGGKCNAEMRMKICSWAKVPKVVESDVENFVVCCDEAHAMQSTQAQRTKDVLNLVNDKRCVGVLLLTGTPMKNGKPGNLFPLLKAVRHPLGRHQKAFESHFCNGMLKNFGRGPQWDASGSSNLDQLKRKVASNLLHMTKEQCLTELPPMTTVFRDVPVSSRYQVQYEHSIKYLASVQANSSNMRDEAVLGAVQRLRVVCANAKIEATVEMARTVLNKEPAVVIFTSFSQVAKTVHSKLETSGWPCNLLTGETPQNKRQELVDNFQNGFSSVFVCTFGAGGVGLTLTAASTIILLDRPWTPGETRQAEDRIRRIGQVKKCTSYWMRSFDLDRQIDEMLESKKRTTNAVLDKSQNKKNSAPSAKISINQLVHKFVISESRKNI